MQNPHRLLVLAALATAVATSASAAPPRIDPAEHAQVLELLSKGIAFRTVIPGDQVRPYADYLKGVLVTEDLFGAGPQALFGELSAGNVHRHAEDHLLSAVG